MRSGARPLVWRWRAAHRAHPLFFPSARDYSLPLPHGSEMLARGDGVCALVVFFVLGWKCDVVEAVCVTH